MTINASDRTLGLISIWQVLRKMHWEIELVKLIPAKIRAGESPRDVLHVKDANLYATINAASTGLALVDWLFHTTKAEPALLEKTQLILSEADMTDEKTFLASMRKINQSINACHQICNANKHFYLRKRDDKFKVMVGDIVFMNQDGTEDVSSIAHIIQNGESTSGRSSVLEMLISLASWWDDTLSAIDIPDRDLFFPRSAP